MLSQDINKRQFHYCLFQGSEDLEDINGYKTGEKRLVYAAPVAMSANVSEAKGRSEAEQFGTDLKYDKVILTCEMDCPIDEETILWIGIPTSQPHNYVVVRKAVSLHDIVYAIREVTLSG